MQKLSCYLYPNRILLLADQAGFTVEWTNVYQRQIRIYNGVDNVLEFDVKNADQKRIDLTTLNLLQLNVMDSSGNVLPNSPYALTLSATKGIASVVIPQDDLAPLSSQYLKYSVTAVDSANRNIILYCDARFGAVGTLELVGDAMPTFRDDLVYTEFSGEINFMGNVIYHSSALPTKFYEAVPTTVMNIDVYLNKFIGTVYVEGTSDMTISVSSWTDSPQIQSFTTAVATTMVLSFTNVPTTALNYLRVSWIYPDVWRYGSQQSTTEYGSIDKIVIKT